MAEASAGNYVHSKDKNLVDYEPDDKKEAREMVMFKGQSKRLWNELYKVSPFICVGDLTGLQMYYHVTYWRTILIKYMHYFS